LLHEIGRIHTAEEFIETFKNARAAGFKNINIDLMFALPNQNIEEWKKTLEYVIALSPEHISAYSLTLAENTPLAERVGLNMPDDETDRSMYHTARHDLTQAGYAQYEISNFAKPGRESRHNINCWTMKPYIGFGTAAHSFNGKARWYNTGDLSGYISGNVPAEVIYLSKAELLAEKIILGLRLMNGVFEKEFSEVYKNEIGKLLKDGLLKRTENRIFLTPLGMDFANCVFREFI
jgi:oxygen-independent coproporphyrinogen-3 oxidase